MSGPIVSVLVRGSTGAGSRELAVSVEWAGGCAALFWLVSDAEVAARALSKATPGCVHTVSWTANGRKASLKFLNGECVE